MDLIEKFKQQLSLFNHEKSRVRIAISGGADSVALTELFHRAGCDFEIAAVHIIHGIREAGEEDARFVEEFCKKRNITLEIRRVDTPAYAEENGLGIEEAARELRYQVFAEFTVQGEYIAIGHTAGDVVETMLFNLIRGSGPRGLSGIPYERDGIIRPLLSFWREELEKWLCEQNIAWREDESNLDLRFSRNRIRWMLIPELKRVFGEGVIERLRREADIFTACTDFIGERASRLVNESLIVAFDNILVFDTEIATSTLWGFGEILRKGFEMFSIGLSGLTFDTVERLWTSVKTARKGRRFPVGEDLHLEADGDMFFIFREVREFETKYIEIDDTVGARHALPLPANIGTIAVSGKITNNERRTTNNEFVKVPYDGGQLTLRLPSPGDRIDPEHKLRRVLARNGVPRLLRDTVPVLFSGDTPIYSPIIGRLVSQPALFELYVECTGPIQAIARHMGKTNKT